MRRGTTPTHIFSLPFDANLCEEIRIIYAQGGTIKLIKEKDDLELYANQLKIKLTQEETFLFNEKDIVELQVRVKTAENVFASDIFKIRAKRLLEEEVL